MFSFFRRREMGAWRKGRERVSSRPTAGALEGLLLPAEENPLEPSHQRCQNEESGTKLNFHGFIGHSLQGLVGHIE